MGIFASHNIMDVRKKKWSTCIGISLATDRHLWRRNLRLYQPRKLSVYNRIWFCLATIIACNYLIARNTVLRAACDANSASPTSQRSIQSPQPNISPKWSKIYRVWYQWEALNAKRVVTGGDRWQRVTTGDSGWQRVVTGDDGWQRVVTCDDGS